MYYALEIKLCSLKNLAIVLIILKELFEPVVLRKKSTGFALVKNITLGDFTVKAHYWEEKSVFS